MFRPVDLAILVTGVVVTLLLLLLLNDASTLIRILSIFPLVVCALLVFAIPNYHNSLVAIQEIINFYSNNRNYKWRGWCAVYESKRS